MSSSLYAVVHDARDPERLARFWSGLLGAGPPTPDDRGGVVVPPARPGELMLRFVASGDPKIVANRMHCDLTSQTPQEQEATVERALSLGGHPLDIGQGPDVSHVVLGDPEANELCVIAAGNRFLADTAFIGALACDGTRDVGCFWSAVLGWPLVWDQDEETAIQSPHGGSKISWGGPPLAPKPAKNHTHLDLVADGDLDDEIARLLSLGARRIDIGQGAVAWAVLADPDGNEFCLGPASWADGGHRQATS